MHAGSEAMFADLGHFSYSAIQVSLTFLVVSSLCIVNTDLDTNQGVATPTVLVQVAFTFLVYPALILAYMGQAAYLSQHHHTSHRISFYVSVPGMCLSFLFYRQEYYSTTFH